jgi:hypothetical protein
MEKEDINFFDGLSDEELMKESISLIDFMEPDEIDESLRMSITKIDRKDKLARLGGSMAAKLAKERNDPDYKKMIKFKKLWIKYKEKVMRKYGMRGKQAARKAAMKTK